MSIIKSVVIDHENSSLIRVEEILKKFPNIENLISFEDPNEGLQYVIQNKPDLVFLVVEIPNISGIKIAQEINRNAQGVKIVFYSEHSHYAIKAIKTAAFDYLLKPISIDEMQNTLQRFQANYKMNLSEKEMQIIRKMSDGLNSKIIGQQLFISKHTVDKYRRTILEKTNCQNTAELVKFASQVGIV